MSIFRAAPTINMAVNDGADLFKLCSLQANQSLTYDELGLVSQCSVVKLREKGVLVKAGMRHFGGHKTRRRTLWKQGPHYGRFLEEFVKIMQRSEDRGQSLLPVCQEVAVPAI